MKIKIQAMACPQGGIAPLAPGNARAQGAHIFESGDLALARPGALLSGADVGGEPFFRVCGSAWLETRGDMASADAPQMAACPLLEALRDITPGPLNLEIGKKGWSIAVITLSDKGAAGLREDKSGPLAARILRDALNPALLQRFILPDDPASIKALLAQLASGFDLIITTGGTGVAPRDYAPQATAPLLDITLPGFSQAMMAASLAKIPHAVISRALAGVAGKCLIINLPGSARAAVENLEAVLAAIPHTLAKINGDPADCGG